MNDGRKGLKPGIEALARQIEEAQARLREMGGRTRATEETAALLEELHTQMEELHVAEEELRVQSDQLAETAVREVEARQAVDAERRRYRELFEMAPDGYLVTDGSGVIREANQAAGRLLGTKPEWLPGRPLVLLGASPEDRDAILAGLERLSDHAPTFEQDVRLRRRRGDPFDAAVSAAAVRDPRGKVTALRWLVRDITARKTAERQLRELNAELEQRVRARTAELEHANEAKDRFLATLAHELRNPLAAALNAVQLLGMNPREEVRQRAQQIVERQIKHQARLLDDLLNVTRIARGKILLRRQVLDLIPLVRDAVEDWRRPAEEAGLTLDAEMPGRPLRVDGDPTRISQILDNLVHNAIKFTSPGGSVRVRVWECRGDESAGVWERGSVGDAAARPASDAPAPDALAPHTPTLPHPHTPEPAHTPAHPHPQTPEPAHTPTLPHPHTPTLPVACVTIQDTGAGMDPELLAHLFESFYQADVTLAHSAGGLGLGLALVKGLVALHGGRVAAHSGGPGTGSTFTVMLPLAPQESEEVRPAAPREAPTGGLRILIIEDNKDMATTLRFLLKMAGHQVEESHTGGEGIQAARRFHPNVVLCDIGLPDINGYDVARALRADPQTASARLIAVSGYGQEEDMRRSHEAGFDHHLTKPVAAERLREVLAVSG